MIFLVCDMLKLNSFVQYLLTKFLFPINDRICMYMYALIYLPTRTSVPSTRVLYWKSVSAYVESCCGLLWILLRKLHVHVSWILNWLNTELHKRLFFPDSRSSHFCNMRKLILDSHEKEEAKCNKVTVTAIKIWTHTCTCNSDVRITGWRECSHQYFVDTNLHEIWLNEYNKVVI